MCARLFVATALSLLGLGITNAEVLSESSKDLGFGFRQVHREQTNPSGSFERIGHFAFLYYKDTNLSQTTIYSIAPSVKYALFQDGPTGNIVLFISLSVQKKVVAKFAGSLATQFKWDEGKKAATVTFANGQTSRVPLNEP